MTTFLTRYPESSQRRARTTFRISASGGIIFLCRSHGNKTRGVASTFLCLAHLCILLKSFCIPSLPRNASSLLSKDSLLKSYLNVTENSGHCYFGGDSICRFLSAILVCIVIVWQRNSFFTTTLRCKSIELGVRLKFTDSLRLAIMSSKCDGVSTGELFVGGHKMPV